MSLSVVNSAFNSGTSTTTVSVSLTGVTDHNTLIVGICVVNNPSSTTTYTTSDNVPNTYTHGPTITGINGINAGTTQIDWVTGISTSGGNVTVKVVASAASDYSVIVYEVLGIVVPLVTSGAREDLTPRTSHRPTNALTIPTGNNFTFVIGQSEDTATIGNISNASPFTVDTSFSTGSAMAMWSTSLSNTTTQATWDSGNQLTNVGAALNLTSTQIVLPATATITANATVAHHAFSLLTNTASISLTARVSHVGSVLLSATSKLTLSAIVAHKATTTLPATGNLVLAATIAHVATTLLSGTSTIVASARVLHNATTLLTATASLSLSAIVTHHATIVLLGTSKLILTAQVSHNASDSLSATSNLTLSAIVAHHATTVLPVTSNLTLSAIVAHHAITVLTATANIVASALSTHGASGTLNGTSNLTLFATVAHRATTLLSTHAFLAANASLTNKSSVLLSTTSNLVISAIVNHHASTVLTPTAKLALSPVVAHEAFTLLTPTANLLASSSDIVPVTATLNCNAFMAASLNGRMSSRILLACTANTSLDAPVAHVATINLTPTATVTPGGSKFGETINLQCFADLNLNAKVDYVANATLPANAFIGANSSESDVATCVLTCFAFINANPSLIKTATCLLSVNSNINCASVVAHVTSCVLNTDAFVSGSARVTYAGSCVLSCNAFLLQNTINIHYGGSGTIVLQGEAPNSTIVGVNTKFQFLWSSSQTPHWYRVEGKCLFPTCDVNHVSPGDNCQTAAQLIVVVAANNITDLCNKLATAQPPINWSIASIKRYSNPEFKTSSANSGCDQLIDETFCQIPACLQFCVDYNFMETVGVTEVVDRSFEYVGSGEIIMSGFAKTAHGMSLMSSEILAFSPPSGHYNGSGTIGLSGQAMVGGSIFNLPVDNVGVSERVSNFKVGFGTTFGSNLSIDRQTVISSCGCSTLPLTLSLTTNLNSSSIFSSFLARNNYVLPSKISLSYKKADSAWEQHLHFKGTSIDGTQKENWTLFFKLFCQNQNLWKFDMLIRKDSGGVFITKCAFDIDSVNSCLNGVLGIAFTYDLTSKQSTGNALNSVSISDEIGLFGIRYWQNSKPKIAISISQIGNTTSGGRKDISPIFPGSLALA